MVSKIIGDVLSDNFHTLGDLLVSADESVLNSWGVCGETPAHIAIYKNHRQLLQQLLQAGADPMRWNETGNSLIHTAVLLGHIELLQMLYDTGKCNLEAANKQGQPPLQIAMSPYQEKDLVAASLFKNWSSSEDDMQAVQQMITAGRAACYDFLREKLIVDRDNTINRQVREISEHMTQRDRMRRLASASSGKVVLTTVSALDFPTGQGKQLMSAHEQAYFQQFKAAVNASATAAFTAEVVHNSIFMNRSLKRDLN